MTYGIGCGFSDGGNRAADARKRSTSIRNIWTVVILCMVFMSVEVVSVRSHPWIAARAEPNAHQFMSRFV
jgi:hypothetical protein